MNRILLNLKGTYLLVIVLIILAMVCVYIDSVINKKKLNSSNYIKIGILVGVISMICIYINTIKGSIQESIHTGSAPF